MTSSAPTPAADVRIDDALVTSLLRTLMPQARAIALGDRHEGRDYVTWRFGDEWAIRLPRRQLAVDRQLTEIAWLPRIGGAWPFKAPIPVRIGGPTPQFPWPWTVVPWIEGEPIWEGGLSLQGARDLGYGLRMVHEEAPPQAPLHPVRSQSLSSRAARADDRLATLARRAESGPWRLDANAARRIYYAGAREQRQGPRWTHLDLRPAHIIAQGGELVGIIDWGDAAAGDPATDLGQAFVALPSTQWDALIEGYGWIDASTFARARAEAVEFAVGLALSPDAREAAWGWQALGAIGVAQHT